MFSQKAEGSKHNKNTQKQATPTDIVRAIIWLKRRTEWSHPDIYKT